MTVLYVESQKFLVNCSFSNTGPKVNEIKYRIFGATYDSSYAQHGEPQALATEIWGKICPPSDQKAIV